MTILDIKNLKMHYPVFGGVLRHKINSVKAVDGIDLTIKRGECLGLVGESGCGKTTTGKALVRLFKPTSGDILFYHKENPAKATNLSFMSEKALAKSKIRQKLQMIFQDPTTSLNPRMIIKNIIAEPIRLTQKLTGKKLVERIVELLDIVGLNQMHLLRYPHEFSGGQRQRIAIARAIATNPEFIVMDEPTSALDVSVQAQILNLLAELRSRLGLTYLFVTHHLLVVKYISDRIAVMYLGKIVELAKSSKIFSKPLHPYTYALLSGIPMPDMKKRKKIVLEGDVPTPLDPPSGCNFHTRCFFCLARCKTHEPKLEKTSKGHYIACHRKDEMETLMKKEYGLSFR